MKINMGPEMRVATFNLVPRFQRLQCAIVTHPISGLLWLFKNNINVYRQLLSCKEIYTY